MREHRERCRADEARIEPDIDRPHQCRDVRRALAEAAQDRRLASLRDARSVSARSAAPRARGRRARADRSARFAGRAWRGNPCNRSSRHPVARRSMSTTPSRDRRKTADPIPARHRPGGSRCGPASSPLRASSRRPTPPRRRRARCRAGNQGRRWHRAGWSRRYAVAAPRGAGLAHRPWHRSRP